MPLPLILGTVARVAGGSLARGAATSAGLGEGSVAMAGRVGSFLGGATFNTADARVREREAERADYPPGDDRR